MHMTLYDLALPTSSLPFLLRPIESFHISHTGLSTQQTYQASTWNSTIVLSVPSAWNILINFSSLIIGMKTLSQQRSCLPGLVKVSIENRLYAQNNFRKIYLQSGYLFTKGLFAKMQYRETTKTPTVFWGWQQL